MSEFWSQVSSPTWWISSVVVALIVNLASQYLFEKFRSGIQLPSIEKVGWIWLVHCLLGTAASLASAYILATGTSDPWWGKWMFVFIAVISPFLLWFSRFELEGRPVRQVIALIVFVSTFVYGVYYLQEMRMVPLTYWFAAIVSAGLSGIAIRHARDR